MERNLVTEKERFALARVGVRVPGPIRAPFFTDATSQYKTLRHKVNPASLDTFSNQPGQVGLLLYIKSFPRARDPNQPSRDEVRDAVLTEMQNALVIHLDHSDNSRSGPVKVLGNRGAAKLTSELSDLISYIREIKKRLHELVGDVASHGTDIPDILSFVAAGCQQMNLITLREMLIGFPKDPRWTIDEAWATEEKPWHNKGNVLVHRQCVARELVSLLSRRWWTLDRERRRIDHFATQIFTAKFGASPKNMASIVRQCYLEHPYRNEDPTVTQQGPDDFRYRMTECVHFIDAYQSWMVATRHIWGSGRGNRNRGAPGERTITRTDIQTFDRIYDDFMDNLFNAAKLLQDDVHEADIEKELESCEHHSRALYRRLVNHPQHLRLNADPSQGVSDVTSPAQTGTRSQTGRSIPPIEREQIGLIEKWFNARWTDAPKVRPLAIYRSMLPPKENMGRRRKEPELVDRQQRVMTRAVVPQNNGPNLAENVRGNFRAPNGAPTPQAGDRVVFNQGREFRQRGRRGNSNTQGGNSQGGNWRGRGRGSSNAWGGNAWGGKLSTPEDATDNSESEPSPSGDDKARDGRESLRGQKQSRVFDPVEEVVVRPAKRHRLGETDW